jgi:hypothetical protein
MNLEHALVIEKLKSANVEHLYHANTVRTTCTFLRSGKLLSRGQVEKQRLDQTYQKTDEDDKRLGLWNDLFFDAIDIHHELNRANHYGPILFEFSIDILAQYELFTLWVTKENPIHWNNETRWFTANELGNYDFQKWGSFKNHIVIREMTQDGLSLVPYLNRIIIDDPCQSWSNRPESDVYTCAIGALLNSARTGGLLERDIKWERRISKQEYLGLNKETLERFFYP